MRYRRLGNSGLNVSTVAFGAWQIGDPAYWGEDARAENDAAVHAAIEAGINLFDTAESYGAGQSEEALGRALGVLRDKILIATKVSPDHCAPEVLRRSCEASLRRLRTDHIDIYQVHWPFRHVPFEDAYEELQRLQQEGKVREIGVSNFGARDLTDWMNIGHCVSNQLGYSLAFRAVEYEILPACRERNVGVLVYMPLLQGVLTHRWKTIEEIPQQRRRTRHFSSTRPGRTSCTPGVRHGEPGCEALLFETLAQLDGVARDLGQLPATVALAWLLAQPTVTSVITGARNPAQLKRNLGALELELDARTLRRLDALTAPLKEHFGTNADMWMGIEGSRIR